MWRDSSISRATEFGATKGLVLANIVGGELFLKFYFKKD
jgi:hypothetical protein